MFLLVFGQLIVYFLFGFIFGIIEKMNFSKYVEQLIETFIKIFVCNVIPRYIFYSKIEGNLLIPSVYNFVASLTLYILTQDIIFWIIHKSIHMEPFYTMIHKKHHSSYVTYKYGLFGKYMSIYDFIMFELLNMPLKIIYFNKSILSMCVIDYIDYVLTLSSHSKLFKLNGHHKMHHSHTGYNFGILPISDYIFNTFYKIK
jgi:sterol desaturase/sphingolipid hydroxylase (fatty acid hydroxylase superfamily)